MAVVMLVPTAIGIVTHVGYLFPIIRADVLVEFPVPVVLPSRCLKLDDQPRRPQGVWLEEVWVRRFVPEVRIGEAFGRNARNVMVQDPGVPGFRRQVSDRSTV